MNSALRLLLCLLLGMHLASVAVHAESKSAPSLVVAKPKVSAPKPKKPAPPKPIPGLIGPQLREIRSIPYPNGALYVERGLNGAFLGGKHRNLGEDASLFQWQGELGYFYLPYLSGGVGFRIIAGEPNDSAQKIDNRYFLIIRLHKAWEDVAVYMGPQLGIANLNILTGSPEDTKLKTPIKNTKPTLGLDMGGGWKFYRYVGATLGGNLEYSLVDGEGAGITNALNLHVNPGLAIDVLAFTDSMRELVSAFYVSMEFQIGFLIFEKTGQRRDQSAVLGIGLAF